MSINRLFAGVFLLASMSVLSQNQPTLESMNKMRNWNFGIPTEDSNSNISGSQYFEDKFVLAKISMIDDQNFEVRYNAAKDEMEFKMEGKILWLKKEDSLTVSFLLEKKTYEFQSYEYNSNAESGFLVRKTKNNKVNIYVKEKITFIPYKDAINSYEQPVAAHYKKEKDIFLISLDSKIIQFPKKRKDFLNLFSEKKSEVENFIKSNKIDFNNLNHLTSLANFLNNL